MTIYIGNTTRQQLHLEVRLPEMNKNLNQIISSGRQVEIKNLTESQENYLIEHMARYGARDRKDLHGKAAQFTGWVYSDKPLKMEEFMYGFEEVMEHAENRAVIAATKSALAADMAMVDKQTGARLSKSTEIEMEEEHVPKGRKGRKMKLTVDPTVGTSDSIPVQ